MTIGEDGAVESADALFSRLPCPARPEVVPFLDAHADGAARLLAERQARLRADLAGAARALVRPAEARSRLDALRSADSAVGFAAVDGDRLVGFLVGETGWTPRGIAPAGSSWRVMP